MGTTLACREDSIIDPLLKVERFIRVFLEENQTRTRTTKRLVSVIRLAQTLGDKAGTLT